MVTLDYTVTTSWNTVETLTLIRKLQMALKTDSNLACILSISTEYGIKTTKENCIHKDLFISLLYVKNEHEKKVTGLNFTFCLTFQGKTFLVCWLFSAHCLGSLVLVAKNQWH